MLYEGHGDHWAAFFPDTELFAAIWLPELKARNVLIAPKPVLRVSAGDAHGFAVDQNVLTGLAVIQAEVEDGVLTPFFRSAYPFPTEGIGYYLVVCEVHVWSNGLEAIVTAEWPEDGGPILTFFDPLFFAHKDRVVPGAVINFHLSAVAYAIRTASDAPILVTDPEMIAAARGDTGDTTPLEFSVAGSAMLLPLPERPYDDYGFRGIVQAVDWLDAFDQSVARLRVTIIWLSTRQSEADGEDVPIDVDLFVPAAARADDWQVAVGDEVEGELWLLGRSPVPGPWG